MSRRTTRPLGPKHVPHVDSAQLWLLRGIVLQVSWSLSGPVRSLICSLHCCRVMFHLQYIDRPFASVRGTPPFKRHVMLLDVPSNAGAHLTRFINCSERLACIAIRLMIDGNELEQSRLTSEPISMIRRVSRNPGNVAARYLCTSKCALPTTENLGLTHVPCSQGRNVLPPLRPSRQRRKRSVF